MQVAIKKMTKKMTKNNYVLTEGSDNTVWVSIQPLQSDILNTIKEQMEIDVDTLSIEQQNHVGLKMIQLKGIYDFLDALLIEHNLNKANGTQTTH